MDVDSRRGGPKRTASSAFRFNFCLCRWSNIFSCIDMNDGSFAAILKCNQQRQERKKPELSLLQVISMFEANRGWNQKTRWTSGGPQNHTSLGKLLPQPWHHFMSQRPWALWRNLSSPWKMCHLPLLQSTHSVHAVCSSSDCTCTRVFSVTTRL